MLQFTALQLTLTWNKPVPSTKHGRRSWKYDWNAVRFSTDGSASTCPKSGFAVALSVRFDATGTLTSPPTENCWSRPNPVPLGTVTFFVTKYGVISGRRGEARPSSPVISPSWETNPAWLR